MTTAARRETTRPALSLVFPVFDEERTIGQVIESALTTGQNFFDDFEGVVVVDGSQDGTPRIIDQWGRRDARVPRCRRRPCRRK